MIIYYGNNDYRDYLAHHGIVGMKWGHQNGPPYPLGADDHSASEKKAGWRRSLSSTGRGDLKRRKSFRDRLLERRAEKNEARAKAAEEKTARDAEKLEAKKKSIADRVVDREDMRALQKKSTAKLFSTEEIRDIANRIDEERARKELIASKSKSTRPGIMNKPGEVFTSIKKKKLIEEGDADKILKNSKLFTAEEIKEVTEKLGAEQKLREARTNARIYAVKTFVTQSAVLAKNISDIGTSVVSAKRSLEALTGKSFNSADNINKIIASGDRGAISNIRKYLNAEQADKATKSIQSQDKLDDLFKKSGTPGSSDTSSQSRQNNQPQRSNQQRSNQNDFGSIQNDSGNTGSSSKPKAPSVDMTEFWRSSAEKYDPNIAVRKKLDPTPMDKKASRAMDKEISKYTQMTSSKAMREVAEGVSKLQVMGSDWRKSGYTSAEEAGAVRQANKRVTESQQRLAAAEADRQEKARFDEAIKSYRKIEANRKRAETRARNKAEAERKAQQEVERRAQLGLSSTPNSKNQSSSSKRSSSSHDKAPENWEFPPDDWDIPSFKPSADYWDLPTDNKRKRK